MTINELVELLEGDLANEYAHWHFYMQAATNVRGLHRQELSEFFLEQATGEMKHVEEFRRLIRGLKTRKQIPWTAELAVAEFPQNLTCPIALLEAALEMENQVVSNYVLRHSQAEGLAASSSDHVADATYIALFLEDQILDSRGDADNILEMLQGIDRM